MRHAALVLVLVTGCLRPAQPKSHGLIAGGLLVTAGGLTIAAIELGSCKRTDGLIDYCGLDRAVLVSFGAFPIALATTLQANQAIPREGRRATIARFSKIGSRVAP